MEQLSYLLKALRPRQWTKNLIVFAAPLFAFSISLESFAGSLLAFFLFCCASSSFYLFNDIADVEIDRQHPVKCKRPIASGLVSIPIAIATAVCLLGVALTLGLLRSPYLGASILSYAVLQIAYNLKLKHKIIVDILAIAAGFVLRAYAGAAATGIILSPWFLLCTGLLALFLAIEKRKAELRLLQLKGTKPRSVLYRYSLPLLVRMEATVTTGTVLTYALWSSGPRVQGASTPWMMITLPFVIYGIFRYQFLSDPEEISRRNDTKDEKGGRTERPEEILLKDMPILLNVMSWVFTVFLILFLKQQGLIE